MLGSMKLMAYPPRGEPSESPDAAYQGYRTSVETEFRSEGCAKTATRAVNRHHHKAVGGPFFLLRERVLRVAQIFMSRNV